MAINKPIVIDTNILLDCFVFKDQATTFLHQQLMTSKIHWIATQAMEEEFLRVLGYAPVLRWTSSFSEQERSALRCIFKTYAHCVAAPAHAACVSCRDADDQMFIDLAAPHHALLISKDKELLRLRSKLLKLEVQVLTIYSINDYLVN